VSGPLVGNSCGSKFVFKAKIGTLVRVYIREHSFPHKNARLFFEGTLIEIVQKKNPAGDLRFRDGYVTLRGNFSTRLGGKWKRSEHKKIAIGDITRILEVKLPEMAE
jgi:hypothetical protein